jgi:putative chitinase
VSLSKENFITILRGNPSASEWADAALVILPEYEINTPQRVAGFFAQCGHESMNFRVLEENLNYTAEALDRVFPKYFSKVSSKDFAKQPEKIANLVYGNRMGNVNSGDGYLFRGRGPIQLTGRDNYTSFGESIGLSPEQVIDYIQTKEGALKSACWYWKTRNINLACDANDIVKMTKLVNGGTHGLEDRKKRYISALQILSGVVKRGSKGESVKRLQAALGLSADGIFGANTEAALKKWQTANNLYSDGIAGPQTLKKLL